MQLRHWKNVTPAQDAVARVMAIAFAPNGRRMAVVDATRSVHLVDETGTRRDKFSTRSSDPAVSERTYAVTGMAFSPDSMRLAIAQTDKIVFVFKLGLEWGDKKSICNRFKDPAAITALAWPNTRNNELVFGTADGRVRIANTSSASESGKSQGLYDASSPCVSLSARPDGGAIVSGHLDGTLWRFVFDDSGASSSVAYTKLATHPCIPYALVWAETIVAAGSDMRVVFYGGDGAAFQNFDYSVTPDRRTMTTAVANPCGYTAAVGSWGRVRVFNYNARQRKWEEGVGKDFDAGLGVTALAWRADGTRLAIGTTRGAVDLYDACLRRYRYRGKFEFTYVAHNNVVVRRISSGARIVLRSQHGHEVTRVNVFQDRYLVSFTATTLLLGDLTTCALSEVPWRAAGSEKFIFDNPGVALVYAAGELALVEYGRNELLGTCRTEFTAPALLSVRVFGAAAAAGPGASATQPTVRKAIAYLVDRLTVRVLDLVSGITIATVHHNRRIDWLELNPRATRLLFRDKERALFVVDLASQNKTTLLNYCSYVQWVPDSDVVVAQNRGDMCVWYAIDAPERVWSAPIKGEIDTIERTPGVAGAPGKTQVVVEEGSVTAVYSLDEGLIEFGSAMEDGDVDRACELLAQIAVSPETEAMWQTLAAASLDGGKFLVAERCYAALGDVARSRALMKINELAAAAAAEQAELLGNDSYDGYSHWSVRAAVAILRRNFKLAEAIFLEQGKVEEAMAMWRELRRYDAVVDVAVARNQPDADQMRDDYFRYLLDNHQQERAAEIRVREGRWADAVDLYLKAGLPARAAHVMSEHSVAVAPAMLEAIASALLRAQMFEKAGEFLEKLQQHERAIDAYKRGHAFRRAVELSRRVFPAFVVPLEDAWGDWLVSQKQTDQAINHYIEAGEMIKAIEAAKDARLWGKVVQIVDSLDPNDVITRKFCKLVATHFEDSRQYPEAEKYYLKALEREAAVEMYVRVNRWDAAHKVAKQHMTDDEVRALYIQQARQLESAAKYKDAERLYLNEAVGECDMAIGMYKKARMYDDMVRLVAIYHKELLLKTHVNLAQHLEREGQLKQAEHHFIEAKEWMAASNMYKEAGQWEDALRVARRHGGVEAGKKVVFAWAQSDSMGMEAGAKLLTKFGLVEEAIDYAIEAQRFDYALELATKAAPVKLPVVHLKHAMHYEDEGRFGDAEHEFVKAGKPREAIDMYIDSQDWAAALRVADTFDPQSVSHVYHEQGKVAFGQRRFDAAESFMLKAARPDALVKLYKDSRMWTDALRIAGEHCKPDAIAALKAEYAHWLERNAAEDPLAAARAWEESQEYARAVEAYTRLTLDAVGRKEAELAALYQHAVELAVAHCKDRLPDVLGTVAERLMELKRHKQAADMFVKVEDYRGAVEVLCRGELWDAARAIADNVSGDLGELVKRLHLQYIAQKRDGDKMLEQGNVEEALNIYAKNAEWDKAMTVARKSDNTEMRLRYSALYVQWLVGEARFSDAMGVVATDGLSQNVLFWPFYVAAFKGPVGEDDVDEEGRRSHTADCGMLYIPSTPGVDVHHVRDGLKVLCDGVKAAGPSEQLTEADELLRVTHYYATAETARQNGLPELAARLMCAALRHAGAAVPADKAYFDAGAAVREVESQRGVAFVLLNRFLDIVDAMDDATFTSTELDQSDFVKSDVPQTFPMPRVPAVAPAPLEDVRQWVLTVSLDKELVRALKVVPCPRCGETMADFCGKCPACQAQFEICCVSGAPILQADDRAECRACRAPAIRDEWNRLVMKTKACPWCANPQAPIF